jgi:hypothetical protein
MKMKQLTRSDLESARAEVFHMILFALAWVMIGEYSLNFGDYGAAAVIVLGASVVLGLQTIHIYDLEEELPDQVTGGFPESPGRKKRFQLYVIIFLFEAAAIMATWMILLHLGHEDWLVPGFALIAGLHFIPLAKVIKLKSYYLLGVWICILAIIGYLLLVRGKLPDAASKALIGYGCAAGAVADGTWIIGLTMRTLRKQHFRILLRRFPR